MIYTSCCSPEGRTLAQRIGAAHVNDFKVKYNAQGAYPDDDVLDTVNGEGLAKLDAVAIYKIGNINTNKDATARNTLLKAEND